MLINPILSLLRSLYSVNVPAVCFYESKSSPFRSTCPRVPVGLIKIEFFMRFKLGQMLKRHVVLATVTTVRTLKSLLNEVPPLYGLCPGILMLEVKDWSRDDNNYGQRHNGFHPSSLETTWGLGKMILPLRLSCFAFQDVGQLQQH